MGEGKLTPLTTPTPLNRQSTNIAHVITSTICPNTPHMVKIATGVTSPHIAKVITQFLWTPAQRKRVSMLYFANVLFIFAVLFVFFVNDFTTIRGPVHAKFCMQAYSGSECVFSPFGGWRPTPLNRQSTNIANVITSTISPHTPHMVKIAPGFTSHYHSFFYIYFFVRKIFPRT